ncbi:MAG: hypothetical protein ACRD8W_29455 [Nitrososphaeraceae archaeon]
MNRPDDPTPNCRGIFPCVLIDIKNNTYIAAAVLRHKSDYSNKEAGLDITEKGTE